MKYVFRATAVFLLSIFPLSGVYAATFSDTPETHLYYQAVEYLAEKGVIHGYEDGLFRPEQTINRVELLKMMMEAREIVWEIQDESVSSEPLSGDSGGEVQDDGMEVLPETDELIPIRLFVDIETDSWYIPYLEEAVTHGIVSGYDDDTFRPSNTVNLVEALKILLLTFEVSLENADSSGTWYTPYIDYAKHANIIEVEDDGLLHPEQDMTRGKAAETLYRLIYIRKNALETFDITLNWPTFTKETHHFSIQYPPDWEILESDTRTVTWKRDEGQITFEQNFPNAARITLYIDRNETALTSDAYFEALESHFSSYGAEMKRFSWNSYPTMRITLTNEHQEMNDWYVFLPNNKVLIFYARIGTGLAMEQLKKEMIALEHSFSYIEYDEEAKDALKNALATARENIYVDGKGQETLNLFADRELIETDAIGIGTGPVDYYFSAWADVTLKYERSFDVILGITEGETTAF